MPGVLKDITAPVAQWKEQRSSKPKVVGSNPAGGAWEGMTMRILQKEVINSLSLCFLRIIPCLSLE